MATQVAGKNARCYILHNPPGSTDEMFIDEFKVTDTVSALIDKSSGLSGIPNVDGGFGDGKVSLRMYVDRRNPQYSRSFKRGRKITDLFLFIVGDHTDLVGALFFYFPSLQVLDAKTSDPQEKRVELSVDMAVDGPMFYPGDTIP